MVIGKCMQRSMMVTKVLQVFPNTTKIFFNVVTFIAFQPLCGVSIERPVIFIKTILTPAALTLSCTLQLQPFSQSPTPRLHLAVEAMDAGASLTVLVQGM